MQRILVTVVAALVLTGCITNSTPTIVDHNQVLGQWYTQDQVSIIHFYKKGAELAGRIVWIAEPIYPEGDEEAGKPRRDRHNPDVSKRNDPELGLEFMKGFQYDEKEKAWLGGTVYDPNTGNTYKCIVRFTAKEVAEGYKELDVRGYLGSPALGQTRTWSRVSREKMIDVSQFQ